MEALRHARCLQALFCCCRPRYLYRRQLSKIATSNKPSTITTPPEPPPPLTGYAPLPARRLLSVHGADAPQFLQGLTTADIKPPSAPQTLPPPAIYSAFLNAQGRLLHDVLIHPLLPGSAFSPSSHASDPSPSASSPSADPAYLIEVDAGQLPALAAWLRRYKLRSKVTIRALPADEARVFSAWSSDPADATALAATAHRTSRTAHIALDTRVPSFGHRLLLPASSSSSSSTESHHILPPAYHPATTRQYTVRRYLHGLPEGPAELAPGAALPHESNLDLMRGVDFRKGCYVGQELVIRTQHTGVVRKRILPLLMGTDDADDADAIPRTSAGRGASDGPPPPPPLLLLPDAGAELRAEDDAGVARPRSAGRVLGRVGNVGLGLCRLDSVLGGAVRVAGPADGNVWVRALVPDWWAERGVERRGEGGGFRVVGL